MPTNSTCGGRRMPPRHFAAIVERIVAIFALGLLATGCGERQPGEVVVYTALDREFSQPIFEDFTNATGVIVRPKYDTESTKTVQLTQAILAERERPRCDLFWNNEILNTLRLDREGLLRAYASPAAARFPKSDQSSAGTWYGFAARARVLIVNTNRIAEDRRPKSIRDLTDPQWYEQTAIAKPLFGTTATHAACLFAAWGDEPAKEFFQRVKRNARIMAGNKQVAQAVAAGQISFGLTDTDDAIIEVEKGMPVSIVYPDQGAGEIGTLFIPNAISLIKDSPHGEAAEKLLNYLLSPAVERRLADGPSAQIPLGKGVAASDRVKTPKQVRAMQVDFEVAAAKWDTASAFLTEEFAAAD